MIILSSKIIDNLVSLTASEEVATFEVENIQDPLGSSRWRSTGLTPNIVMQFDSTLAVDGFGGVYINAQSGDEWRWRFATSQANLTASPLYDSTMIDVWAGSPSAAYISSWEYAHGFGTFSSVNALWARVDFDFTGNTDGYVQLGGLYPDARFAPAFGPHNVGINEAGRARGVYQVNYADGAIERGGGSHKRPAAFQLIGLTDAEYYNGLEPKLSYACTRRPFLVVVDENESTYPMHKINYGYLTADDVRHDDYGHDATLRVEEL